MNRILAAVLAALAVGCTLPLAADPVAEARVADALAKAFPELVPDEIEPTPVPGLFAVVVGTHILYVSDDGRYLIRGGELLDIEHRVNLTENSRKSGRLEVMESIPAASLITFSPAEPRHVVTIFTDIDCPYCAKLHAEMDAYNALGIEVRYAAFPRAGIPSDSYDKTVSVWCAEDPRVAIGDAKAGRPVEPRECDNPVAGHYEAGQRIGVRGTPAIVLVDGSVLPGYVPAERLARMLDGDG